MTVDIGLLVIKGVSFYFPGQMMYTALGCCRGVSYVKFSSSGCLEGTSLALGCVNILA